MQVAHCRGGHFTSGKSVPEGAERSGLKSPRGEYASGYNLYYFNMCEKLVPILHVCEILVPVLHVCEILVPILHTCEELVPILHTSEFINMWNLSTDFTPQKISKLTIRKSHILQMWCIGTNSSYGCEIYEVWNLRFNKAHLVSLRLRWAKKKLLFFFLLLFLLKI